MPPEPGHDQQHLVEIAGGNRSRHGGRASELVADDGTLVATNISEEADGTNVAHWGAKAQPVTFDIAVMASILAPG